jgi:hypothetical protein
MARSKVKQAMRKKALVSSRKRKAKVQSRSPLHPEAVIHQGVFAK